MKRTALIFLSAILFALFAAACMGPNEQAIQGTWEYRDPHLMTVVASEKHLTVVWYFNHGSFSYWACCFNLDQEFSGHYRILSVEENIITLELYNMQNLSSRSTIETRIVIDPETNELNIQGSGPFVRLEPDSEPGQ